MPDTRLAQTLLALFTSRECAEAIAGDFVEARGDRGPAWFWRQVLSTSASLCGHAVTSAPFASLRLVAAGWLLFGSMSFAGVALVATFPALLGTPASWVWLSVAWWSAAWFTGFTLVHLSPTRGMPAAVLFALIVEAVLVTLGVTLAGGEILAGPSVLFYSIASLAAVPLLAGGMAARRPQPADLASFAVLRAFVTRVYGTAGPEARLRATCATPTAASAARGRPNRR